MKKRYRLNRPDLFQAVTDELRKKHYDEASRKRLFVAWLAGRGTWPLEVILDRAKISRRCFFGWMKAFKSGGVAGLLSRQHGGGRVPKVQGAVRDELMAGLASGRWKRAKEVQRWLQQQHGVWLNMPAVYYWIRKLRRVLKERP